MFLNAHLRGLGSDVSDYYALLLQMNLGQMTKARFHLELLWPKFGDHEETIAQAWLRPIWPTDPLVHLDCMLRALVCEL
jgi:hypothetical protein